MSIENSSEYKIEFLESDLKLLSEARGQTVCMTTDQDLDDDFHRHNGHSQVRPHGGKWGRRSFEYNGGPHAEFDGTVRTLRWRESRDLKVLRGQGTNILVKGYSLKCWEDGRFKVYIPELKNTSRTPDSGWAVQLSMSFHHRSGHDALVPTITFLDDHAIHRGKTHRDVCYIGRDYKLRPYWNQLTSFDTVATAHLFVWRYD